MVPWGHVEMNWFAWWLGSQWMEPCEERRSQGAGWDALPRATGRNWRIYARPMSLWQGWVVCFWEGEKKNTPIIGLGQTIMNQLPLPLSDSWGEIKNKWTISPVCFIVNLYLLKYFLLIAFTGSSCAPLTCSQYYQIMLLALSLGGAQFYLQNFS